MVKKVISRKYGRTLIQYPVILPSHPSNNKSICLIYYFSNCGHEYVLNTYNDNRGDGGGEHRLPAVSPDPIVHISAITVPTRSSERR